VSFNSNLIKVALNSEEEPIACFIVALYPVRIEEAAIDYAVANKFMEFLHTVFHYQKQLMIMRRSTTSTQSGGHLVA